MNKRQYLNHQVLESLYEARRALGYAAKARVMCDREQYLSWMESAFDILFCAWRIRRKALKTPWSM